jgi:hypothetical protein
LSGVEKKTLWILKIQVVRKDNARKSLRISYGKWKAMEEIEENNSKDEKIS